MLKIAAFFSRRNAQSDEGFTIIEVLVSVLIGLVVWRGSILATRVLSASSERSIATTRILQLDDSLRREVGRIHLPFWLAEIGIEQTDHGIVLPYYRGDPDDSLTIAVADNYLDVSSLNREQAFHIGPFPGIRAETAYDAQENPVGVRIWIESAKDNTSQQELFFRFGSSPLWVEDEKQ